MIRNSILLIFTLLLVGCEKPTDPTHVSSANNSTGKISLSLDKQNAPAAVNTLVIILSRSGFSSLEKVIDIKNDSAASVLFDALAIGSWKINIDAKGSDGKILYTGQSDVIVFENSVSVVNITLNAVASGTGSVVINVSWGGINPVIFPKTYGGTSAEMGMSVFPTSDGGSVLGGISHSLGEGGGDAWVVKTDVNGIVLWSKSYGTTGEDRVNSILQTSDGGYLFVGYKHVDGEDSWIVKLDSIGNVQWTKNYGLGGDDAFLIVKQLSDGNYLTCGYTYTSNWGAGNFYDGRMMKFTSTGEILWSKTLGSIGGDFTMNFVEVPQEGIYVSGYNGSNTAHIYDLWLIKMTQSGDVLWEKTYGTQYEERSAGITTTSDGNLMISGFRMTNSTRVGTITKIDTSGKELWTKEYPSVNGDMLKMNTLSDNSVLVSGYSTIASYGQQGMLMKINNDGIAAWTKYYGGTGTETFSEFQLTKDNRIIVIGTTSSTGAGMQDYWLLKLTNDGIMQ